jgi:curved DNA-binding protein CbpA
VTSPFRFTTHYDNLKVARNAPLEVIRSAYRALAQKYHPDRYPDSAEATRIMGIINEAYAVLSDPQRRAHHDRWIAEQERLQIEEPRAYAFGSERIGSSITAQDYASAASSEVDHGAPHNSQPRIGGTRRLLIEIAMGSVAGAFAGLVLAPTALAPGLSSDANMLLLVSFALLGGVIGAVLFKEMAKSDNLYEVPLIMSIACSLAMTWLHLVRAGFQFESPWAFLFSYLTTPYAWGVSLGFALAILAAALVVGGLIAWKVGDRWGFNLGALSGSLWTFVLLRMGALKLGL